QRIDVEAVTRVHRLGEINDRNLASPIEDVVGREIAVDAVTGEEQLDVAQDALKERPRLLTRKLYLVQQRRRLGAQTDILHRHAIANLRGGSRHVCSGPVEEPLRLELVGDP